MSETVITVQGTASDWFDAERATLHVTVAFDGPARQPVYDAAVRTANEVTAALAELDGSAVTRWSSDRVSVSSHRPWNNEGAQLAPVYTARITVTARFQDFEALSALVDRFAPVAGITVNSIQWDLTEEKRLAVTADIQTRAVHDATVKATTYARAAGLASVTALAIADPGMLGDGGSNGGYGGPVGAPMMMRGSAKAADAPTLEFTPDRIEVSASVDARFRAS